MASSIGHISLGGRQLLAAEALAGRLLGIRIEQNTLTYFDPRSRELLRARPNPLTWDQAQRLRGARRAGPPPAPGDLAGDRAAPGQQQRRHHGRRGRRSPWAVSTPASWSPSASAPPRSPSRSGPTTSGPSAGLPTSRSATCKPSGPARPPIGSPAAAGSRLRADAAGRGYVRRARMPWPLPPSCVRGGRPDRRSRAGRRPCQQADGPGAPHGLAVAVRAELPRWSRPERAAAPGADRERASAERSQQIGSAGPTVSEYSSLATEIPASVVMFGGLAVIAPPIRSVPAASASGAAPALLARLVAASQSSCREGALASVTAQRDCPVGA